MKHSRIITEDLVNVVRDNIHTEARGMSLANDIHSSTLITHDLCVKKKNIEFKMKLMYRVQRDIDTCIISPKENIFTKLMLGVEVRQIDKTIIVMDCEKCFARSLRKTC